MRKWTSQKDIGPLTNYEPTLQLDDHDELGTTCNSHTPDNQ